MENIIIVPGLGDDTWILEMVIKWWNKKNTNVCFFETDWGNKETYQEKLSRLLRKIDEEKEGVTLIGISAGASLSLNAYRQRNNKIDKLISLCGRLKNGIAPGFRKQQEETLKVKSFQDSVNDFEKNEKLLTEKDRKKIMTVSAGWGDPIIPANTSTLTGAKNITIPAGGHLSSIVAGLTIYSSKLKEFIYQGKINK